jgi:hypothetical protein
VDSIELHTPIYELKKIEPTGIKKVGRHRLIWQEDAENDLRESEVKSLRQEAKKGRGLSQRNDS